MTRILALDQSVTRTGWALVAVAARGIPEVLLSGTFASSAKGDAEVIERFLYEVRYLVRDTAPDLMVWEKPFQFVARNGAAGVRGSRDLVLTRIDGALVAQAMAAGLRTMRVAPATWRSRVLGKGLGRLSRKEAKMAALWHVNKMLKMDVKEDDRAEAILIGLWAAGQVKAEMAGR